MQIALFQHLDSIVLDSICERLKPQIFIQHEPVRSHFLVWFGRKFSYIVFMFQIAFLPSSDLFRYCTSMKSPILPVANLLYWPHDWTYFHTEIIGDTTVGAHSNPQCWTTEVYIVGYTIVIGLKIVSIGKTSNVRGRKWASYGGITSVITRIAHYYEAWCCML